jgi:hypothetical protein
MIAPTVNQDMLARLQNVSEEYANIKTENVTMEDHALLILAITKEDVSTPISNLLNALLKHNAK